MQDSEPDHASGECHWILKAKDHSYHRQQPELRSETPHLREARASVVSARGLRNVVDNRSQEMAWKPEVSAQDVELIVVEMILLATADDDVFPAVPDWDFVGSGLQNCSDSSAVVAGSAADVATADALGMAQTCAEEVKMRLA